MTAQDKKSKKPLKKMGNSGLYERDTRLDPYRREKINPRDFETDEDEIGEENSENPAEE